MRLIYWEDTMAERRICKHCLQIFIPRPQNPDQLYCSEPACQRVRMSATLFVSLWWELERWTAQKAFHPLSPTCASATVEATGPSGKKCPKLPLQMGKEWLGLQSFIVLFKRPYFSPDLRKGILTCPAVSMTFCFDLTGYFLEISIVVAGPLFSLRLL